MVGIKTLSAPLSTLGRIIRLTEEVIKYREWIIERWGGRDPARTDNRGMIILKIQFSIVF